MRIKHFLVKMLLTVVLVAVGYISHAAINPQDLKTEIIDGLAWSYVVEDGYASVTSWNMGKTAGYNLKAISHHLRPHREMQEKR